MSPAFTGLHFFKDREKLVAKARTLGLTPIIEELEQLNLQSTAKKVKDDTSVAVRQEQPLVQQ
jgi:hypothetical protein